MNLKTLSQVETDLQNLADQVGIDGFPRAKALYFEKVAVTKEDGTPLSSDEVDIVLVPKADAAAEDEEAKAVEDEEEAKAEEDEEEEKAKSIRISASRRKALRVPATKAARRPSRPVYHGKVKSFKDDDNGDAVQKAYDFGAWFAGINGNQKAAAYCLDNGIITKGQDGATGAAGGFLVPEQFETDLIKLREEFGVARQACRIRPMTTDVVRIPRHTAGLTTAFVAESAAIGESAMTLAQVTLTAKKLGCLTTISNELGEDAFISVADQVAQDIAYAFANKEDFCLFMADGTDDATDGDIDGLASALGAAGTFATAEITANTTAGIRAKLTMELVLDMMGNLPHYADTANTKWYMHKSVYHQLFRDLALDSGGGTTATEILNGKIVPQLFGYDVVFSQVMANASTTANGTRLAYFGDISQGCTMGDRRQTTIQTSDSAFDVFEKDEIAIRGTERFDIQCHDVGDGSNAGSVVGLQVTNAS